MKFYYDKYGALTSSELQTLTKGSSNIPFECYFNAISNLSHYATISFERNDGTTINDLAMTSFGEGFKYTLRDKGVLSLAGSFKITFKVKQNSSQTIVASATTTLTILDSVGNVSTDVNISEAQYNSLLEEMNLKLDAVSGLGKNNEFVTQLF